MKKYLFFLLSIAFSHLCFSQFSNDFNYAGSYTTVSKSCGKCNMPVSSSYEVGMHCPHCGVTWGREKTTHRSTTRNVSVDIPSSGLATTSSSTNVRSGPSTDYGIVATLPPLSLVTITGKRGNWVRVSYTDYFSYSGNFEQVGYIRSDLLNF